MIVFGSFPERLAEEINHLANADRSIPTTNVDDFVPDRLEGSNSAKGGIINVCKVTCLRAIAKECDWGAFIDPFDEAKGRHVGAACGSIDRKVAND